MGDGQIIQDDNNRELTGLWDSAGHQVVTAQAVSVATDTQTGQKYGVMNVNASFSASSLAINDPTTTSQKAGVNAGGSLQVAGQGVAGTPAGGVISIQGVAGGTALPISGTISATNPSVGTDGSAIPTSSTLIGASDGTNLQQLLVESSSNRNLRAGIYSGTNEATVTGANALKVDGSGVTQPISGTVTANAGTGSFTVVQATGSNLHAVLDASSAVIGHVIVDSSTIADTIATGNLTIAQATVGTVVAGGTVSITLGDGQSTFEVQLTGTFSSGTTVQFEGTDDSGTTINWFPAVGYNTAIVNPSPITSVSGPGPFIIRGSAAGYQQLRVRASAFMALDNVAVRIVGTTAPLGIGGLLTNDGSFAKETGGNLASIATNTANIPVKGQATMANSLPVAIASNQGALGSVVAQAVAGTALAADQSNSELRVSNYGKSSTAGDVALAVNANGALQIQLVDQAGTNVAGVDSGHRLQTIISSAIPTGTNSIGAVTFSTSATGTITSVVSAASSTQLLASNASRKGAYFYNDSTAILYLALATSASTTAYTVQIPANGFFEIPSYPIFTGAVFGIWSAANGNVRITELS